MVQVQLNKVTVEILDISAASMQAGLTESAGTHSKTCATNYIYLRRHFVEMYAGVTTKGVRI